MCHEYKTRVKWTSPCLLADTTTQQQWGSVWAYGYTRLQLVINMSHSEISLLFIHPNPIPLLNTKNRAADCSAALRTPVYKRRVGSHRLPGTATEDTVVYRNAPHSTHTYVMSTQLSFSHIKDWYIRWV